MTLARRRSMRKRALVALIFAILCVPVSWLVMHGSWPSLTASLAAQPQRSSTDPWAGAQAIEPGDLVKQLANSRPANRPAVVCIGFRSLYRAGHIPTASWHGPASSPEGLAELKRWARGLSRSAEVVLYCGCCPLADCPNLRPAFTALRDMGFTCLRVLILPHNFATDWAGKGYAVER